MPAVVLDRRQTAVGELALLRRGETFEVISGGVFLMSTEHGGRSERLLVRAALDALDRPAHVLIGGLGMGFSLLEALADSRTAAVTVVELEQAVLDWHATHLREVTQGALDDPRVEVVNADLLAWLESCEPQRFDAVCLDIDNGPDWVVQPGNAALYSRDGIRSCLRVLRPDGVLAVWSAHAAPAFERRLRDLDLLSVEVRTVPVPRGEPDHVYLGQPQAASRFNGEIVSYRGQIHH